MAQRKTGKPKALELEEDDDQAQPPALAQETDLDEFLRNNFGESLEGVKSAPLPEGEGLPSLAWLKATFKTKSAAIRHLTIERRFPPAQVARHLGIKYQHVRNVTHQELKRGPNEQFHLGEGQAASEFKKDKD
jgi:hypothetical protein